MQQPIQELKDYKTLHAFKCLLFFFPYPNPIYLFCNPFLTNFFLAKQQKNK